MKILSAKQIRELDRYTIENEPIKSIDLMERAALCYVQYLLEHSELLNEKNIKIFSGRGNNGGDGLVIARYLAEKGYSVTVYCVRTINKNTGDFSESRRRLEKQGKVRIIDIQSFSDIPQIYDEDLVVDAIFGSGLSRKVEGLLADLIEHINKSTHDIVSIDIPSGLYCDKSSKENERAIIHAKITLSFLPPKLAFLFHENSIYYGELIYLGVGLSQAFINMVEAENHVITKEMMAPNILIRDKFSHKRIFGHALLIAGSKHMFGSAVLSVKAALRSGVGLVSAHVAKSGVEILQISAPEALISPDKHADCFSEILHPEYYDAIGVGPGLGKNQESVDALKLLIQNYNKPMVFDADALNILAQNPTWLSFIPGGCIMTPHLREFERLVGKTNDDFERNKMQREFAKRYGVYLVLKGAYTVVACPDGNCFFNVTGNNGMATGGSGDVLTGLITGLLAQGYHPRLAAILGVFLHGLSGDIVSKKEGEEALIAGDLINAFGKAYKIIKS